MPVPETTAARLVRCIELNVVKGAKIYTDEHKSYSGLENHETVNHGDGEYVRGEVHINGMESVWVLIGRGCNGTYHRIEDKHLHRYINEFTGRLNMRALSTIDKMSKIVRGWIGERLTYKQLVASSALCGQHSVESGRIPRCIRYGCRRQPCNLCQPRATNGHAVRTRANGGICRPDSSRVVAAKRSIQ